jgi:ribosomal-protein-alanine N-acetyltransferase
MSLKIRAVESFDLPVLAALHAACFTAPWDRHWSLQSFAEILRMPGAGARIAALGAEPVGFAVARIAADEAELLLIGILPQRRRAGIARALLGHLLEELRAAAVTRLVLEVAAINAAALAFYAEAGFREVGRRPGYYRGETPVDAAILALDLAPGAAAG